LKHFRKKPNGYWNDINNQRAFADSLRATIGSQSPSITTAYIKQHGGSSLLQRYGSVRKFLQTLLPEARVFTNLPFGHRRKSQAFLTDIIKSLFPDQPILSDFKHPDLKFQISTCIRLYYNCFLLCRPNGS
jgi:hypothetical protein